MKKLLALVVIIAIALCGCDIEASGTRQNVANTVAATDTLTTNQNSPTDINYSLERYNLIKRAYWVNGMRERANTLPCAVDKPLGYIVLFTDNGAVVGSFIVDGKVSSLNSYLSPNYVENYYSSTTISTELADVDGSYGENDNGIFFFSPDGKYIEWTGTYLYSDIPFEVDSPIVTYAEVSK